MAIELGHVITRRGTTSSEGISPAIHRPDDHDAFLGHEKLFAFYGIAIDYLTPDPSGKTTFHTRHGDLCIYWNQRAIVPPLEYYRQTRR